MPVPDDVEHSESDQAISLAQFVVTRPRGSGKPACSAAPKTMERSRPFLKGPIPLSWLIRAGGLPGKALLVAVGLWYMQGMSRQRGEVKATSKLWRELRLTRQAGYRGIKALEKVGLISVSRQPGRATVVTLLNGEIRVG